MARAPQTPQEQNAAQLIEAVRKLPGDGPFKKFLVNLYDNHEDGAEKVAAFCMKFEEWMRKPPASKGRLAPTLSLTREERQALEAAYDVQLSRRGLLKMVGAAAVLGISASYLGYAANNGGGLESPSDSADQRFAKNEGAAALMGVTAIILALKSGFAHLHSEMDTQALLQSFKTEFESRMAAVRDQVAPIRQP